MNRLLQADASTAELVEEIPPGTEIVDGAPRARILELDDTTGVWEMTPGSARDVEADEVFVVLAGRGTVAFEDGEVLHLAAGTVVRLRAGERTTWTVDETIRKLYVAG